MAEAKAGARAHLQLHLAQRARAAGAGLRAPEQFAGEGLAHDAEQRHTVVGERNERAPGRQAHHEGAGAVDGIDDPLILGLGAGRAVLLAQHAVARKPRLDLVTDQNFDGLVCRRHRVELGDALGDVFVLDDHGPPVVGQHDLGRGARQVEGEGQKLIVGLVLAGGTIGHGHFLVIGAGRCHQVKRVCCPCVTAALQCGISRGLDLERIGVPPNMALVRLVSLLSVSQCPPWAFPP